MATQKETMMLLHCKVDLECSCCYNKLKKLLCSFPEIHDQIYDEKKNTVKIKVVCCCPEKIKERLCCKGRKYIKSIEIIEPPKEDKGKPKESKKGNSDEKKKKADSEKKTTQVKEQPPQAKPTCCWDCYCGLSTGPCYKALRPVYTTNTCCWDCYLGRTTGPCYLGCGGYEAPPPPPPMPPPGGCCYYGGCPPGGYGYYRVHEQNPSTACVIM